MYEFHAKMLDTKTKQRSLSFTPQFMSLSLPQTIPTTIKTNKFYNN